MICIVEKWNSGQSQRAYCLVRNFALDEVTVTATKEKSNSEKQFEENVIQSGQTIERWMNSQAHPDRLYEGDATYIASYWHSFDTVRDWCRKNNQDKK